MNEPIKPTAPLVKLILIPGLKTIVLDEISKFPELEIIENGEDKLYINIPTDFKNVLSLRSIPVSYTHLTLPTKRIV